MTPNHSPDGPRRDSPLDFLGKISAAVSHEINNVLALLSEQSGLLGDYLTAARAGRPLDPERLARVNDTMRKHIQRGVDIVKRFNRFAHAVDAPPGRFDLADLLKDLAALAHRFAHGKNASIELRLPGDPVAVESAPFAVLKTVFECMALFWEEAGPGGTILIELTPTIDGPEIAVKGKPWKGFTDRAEAADALRKAIEDLGGEAHFACADGVIRLRLPGAAAKETT